MIGTQLGFDLPSHRLHTAAYAGTAHRLLDRRRAELPRPRQPEHGPMRHVHLHRVLSPGAESVPAITPQSVPPRPSFHEVSSGTFSRSVLHGPMPGHGDTRTS